VRVARGAQPSDSAAATACGRACFEEGDEVEIGITRPVIRDRTPTAPRRGVSRIVAMRVPLPPDLQVRP
jgi:hypothetical protein